MVDRTTRIAIERIWGDPLNSKRFSGNASRGMSVRNAAGAGAVIDVPPPVWIRDFAAEHARDQQEKEKVDTRSAFEKKYDIREGAAHVSPEAFRNILAAHNAVHIMQQLRDIIIEDALGLQLKFGAFSEQDEPLPGIKKSDVVKLGLMGALKGQNQAVLYSGKRPLGILAIEDSPDALTRHARSEIHSTVKHYAVDRRRRNFAVVFNRIESLIAAVNQTRGAGGMQIIKTDDTIFGESLFLGTLYHPNDVEMNSAAFPVNHMSGIRGYVLHRHKDVISGLFGDAAGLLICKKANMQKPLAILLRPPDEHSSPGPTVPKPA